MAPQREWNCQGNSGSLHGQELESPPLRRTAEGGFLSRGERERGGCRSALDQRRR